MVKKVLLTATVQSHICQFHRPLVEILHKRGYEVHVAARDNLAEKNGLKLDFVEKVYDVPFSRSPLSRDNIKAYKCLKKILRNENYEFIHCNTPMGGVVTRLASVKMRNSGTKIIYTAHGFHFYKGASFKSWLIYFPIEYILGRFLTDKLITVSWEDFYTAKQKKICDNVYHIHGVGFNEKKYHQYSDIEINKLKELKSFDKNQIIAVCVGELNSNKRQCEVINALPKIINQIPNFLLLLAGNGPEKDNLEMQIQELGLSENAKLIGYRTDLEQYIAIADIVISASCREGLPLNIIEAMACGKPVVTSVNRGHAELVKDMINGFLAKSPSLADNIASSVIRLCSDKKMYKQCSANAVLTAQKYSESNVKLELEKIYFDYV